MGQNNIAGAWGESLAADYLRKKRYKLVATNYRCRFGEIDLIVCDKKYLVFVEVKYRSNMEKGHPVDAVNYIKKNRIIKTAKYYIYKNHINDNQSVGILEYQITKSNIDEKDIIYIKDIYIDVAYRGMSLGKKVINELKR